MRKALILILVLSASFAYCAEPIQLARMNPYVAGAVTTAAGGSCTIGSGANWVNATNNDYWGTDTTEDHNYQKVANSASKQICRIKINITNTGITHNAVVKIKSTDLGTTYGTSDTTEITADITDTQVTFNFTTPSSAITGDFVVSYVDTAGAVNIRTSTTDTYFGGSSYDLVIAGSAQSQDFTMEIWYLQ